VTSAGALVDPAAGRPAGFHLPRIDATRQRRVSAHVREAEL